MIFDGENLFFKEKALSNSALESDVISYGTGEAGEPPWVVFMTSNASGGSSLSTVIETSDNPDMSSATELGTFTGTSFKVKLPKGNKGYLRLKSTCDYTSGTVTAGLVLDVDTAW